LCVFDSLKRVGIDYTSEEIASKAIEFVNDKENLINLDYIKKSKTTTKNILQKN
jgi:hypothetical protein